ncbi:ATP-dependent RNA helicase [Streptantibioticus cattleyicolor NRRL 8057 = DSM 46488]|uniref:ATP-dependent RNA helicase n=1 Tax=Streptantibioticus cattleyicolor (strain ATCC 35852 / DSM 46488 / JCM 4925 / NBRC 14057 / NRRL 8057) TaxID=1003195 RepID=G8WV90_STREN|nr:ATP-dependent RNA helicase [Streptantibioticus cattleyicolor NRRL 8057 = DSM 46488]
MLGKSGRGPWRPTVIAFAPAKSKGALGRGGAEPDHRRQDSLRDIPLDGEPAVPRPKNTNASLHGLGTGKGTSRGAGGKSRKAGEARKLAEARWAALVHRNG